MKGETKDTLIRVVQYADNEKQKLKKKMIEMSLGAAILLVFCLLLKGTNGFGFIPQKSCENLIDFVNGFTLAALVLNVFFLTGVFEKISSHKKKKQKNITEG